MKDRGSDIVWRSETSCGATGVSCILNATAALAAGDASVVSRFGKDGAGDGWLAVWFTNNWVTDDEFEDAPGFELSIIEPGATDRFRAGRFSNAGAAADSLEIESVLSAN
jgi:hypothetical protein